MNDLIERTTGDDLIAEIRATHNIITQHWPWSHVLMSVTVGTRDTLAENKYHISDRPIDGSAGWDATTWNQGVDTLIAGLENAYGLYTLDMFAWLSLQHDSENRNTLLGVPGDFIVFSVGVEGHPVNAPTGAPGQPYQRDPMLRSNVYGLALQSRDADVLWKLSLER